MFSIRRKIFKTNFIRFYTSLFLLSLCLLILLRHEPKTPVTVRLQYVVVHIDLKGSPPKLEYLKSLLPTLQHFGVNSLLMEYEDMFPYDGDLVEIRAKNCYNKSELLDFLSAAVRSGFEIIPLVQTFGHLEYVLKLRKFKYLREVSMYPDSICPSKAESRGLVKNMLQQVADFHNSISPLKHIHIGCDEVYHINQCDQCLRKNLTDIDIFLYHVKIIKDIVKSIDSDVKVLIWDDMLRKTTPMGLNSVDVEPIYWDYKDRIDLSHFNLYKYHKTFKNTWIASAFKGADGQTATLTNIKKRFMNNYSWMVAIAEYRFGGESKVYDFKGIVLTGWSRYSHMKPLCEILPVSMPSLLLNLLLIKRFNITEDNDYNVLKRSIEKEFSEIYQCQRTVNLESIDLSPCKFHSKELYNILVEYVRLSNNIDTGLSNISYIEYYSLINLMNMPELINKLTWCHNKLNELLVIEKKLSTAMSKYYDEFVIQEYVNYKTHDAKKRLTKLINIFQRYKSNDVWENLI